MKTDRELLGLAAKAAGIEIKRSRLDDHVHSDILIKDSPRNGLQMFGPWNPLTDDGDALRLAVELKMCVVVEMSRTGEVWVYPNAPGFSLNVVKEPVGNDSAAATRRAIVRAAAAAGETMP
jgi:hypothetical protein